MTFCDDDDDAGACDWRCDVLSDAYDGRMLLDYETKTCGEILGLCSLLTCWSIRF